jgi:hypothetical protein
LRVANGVNTFSGAEAGCSLCFLNSSGLACIGADFAKKIQSVFSSSFFEKIYSLMELKSTN